MLRELRAAGAPELELRAAGLHFDKALTDALRAAEAGQRATFGVKSYDDRLARRKAKATPKGAMWTAEVDRLRTLREANRLTGIPRLPPSCASSSMSLPIGRAGERCPFLPIISSAPVRALSTASLHRLHHGGVEGVHPAPRHETQALVVRRRNARNPYSGPTGAPPPLGPSGRRSGISVHTLLEKWPARVAAPYPLASVRAQ
ncbi:hypothetical protein [Nonomuraea dietziae]|uniref:hypothetical protein n=1 Tax=Nonomuraea dietziae TaxID=65515 RepID=UPI0031D65545